MRQSRLKVLLLNLMQIDEAFEELSKESRLNVNPIVAQLYFNFILNLKPYGVRMKFHVCNSNDKVFKGINRLFLLFLSLSIKSDIV